MNEPNTATLVQIANLYYIENYSQQQIADEMGVSRSLIALYLKRARNSGIVTIEIRNPVDNCEDLATLLTMKTGINRVFVVPTANNSDLTRRSVAGSMARFLEYHLQDGDVLGLGFGRTMFELPGLLAPARPRKITVVPLVGESVSGYTNSYSQINQIVLQVANAFNGTAHFLLSPLLVGSRELCEMLYKDDVARTVVEYWNHLTFACIGIGTVPPVEGEIVYVGEQNLQTFVNSGAIGDICTRYFDADGKYIQTDLHDRTISVQFEHLKTAKHTCVFSAGTGKACAVYAFLRTGLATELFVDEELAKAILLLYRDEQIK